MTTAISNSLVNDQCFCGRYLSLLGSWGLLSGGLSGARDGETPGVLAVRLEEDWSGKAVAKAVTAIAVAEGGST